MKFVGRFVDAESGQTVIPHVARADGFWSRLCGLQFRSPLPAGHALWLVPCASIHTMWMRFAVDVIMLDAACRVVGVRPGVRPWRVVMAAAGTRSIVEMTGGAGLVEVGQHLRFEK